MLWPRLFGRGQTRVNAVSANRRTVMQLPLPTTRLNHRHRTQLTWRLPTSHPQDRQDNGIHTQHENCQANRGSGDPWEPTLRTEEKNRHRSSFTSHKDKAESKGPYHHSLSGREPDPARKQIRFHRNGDEQRGKDLSTSGIKGFVTHVGIMARHISRRTVVDLGGSFALVLI